MAEVEALQQQVEELSVAATETEAKLRLHDDEAQTAARERQRLEDQVEGAKLKLSATELSHTETVLALQSALAEARGRVGALEAELAEAMTAAEVGAAAEAGAQERCLQLEAQLAALQRQVSRHLSSRCPPFATSLSPALAVASFLHPTFLALCPACLFT